MAIDSQAVALQDQLTPFRRRVRLLLVWRYGAFMGAGAAIIAIILEAIDLRGALLLHPLISPLVVAFGAGVGILCAILRPISSQSLAMLLDRRAGLKDRLATALDPDRPPSPMDGALIIDASIAAQAADPKRTLPLRFGLPQTLFVAALLLLALVRFLPSLIAIVQPEIKKANAEVRQLSEDVKRVAAPVLEEAKKPDATELEKRIAQNIEMMSRKAQAGKLSKTDALAMKNELAEQMKKLESQRAETLKQSAQKLPTGADAMKKLQEMQQALAQQLPNMPASKAEQKETLQKTLEAAQPNASPQQTQEQIKRIQENIEALKRQLEQQKSLTPEQRQALEQQMESLQQQQEALELSQQAREFMQKLANNPELQEAMREYAEFLEQMMKQAESNQQEREQNQQNQMSAEELREMAEQLRQQLEELAANNQSDEQIQQLAQEMADQIREMMANAQGMRAAQGFNFRFGAGLGRDGQGGSDKGDYSGQRDRLNQGDPQEELKIKMKDAPVAGHVPKDAKSTQYMEFDAPPTPGGSNVPLSKALPKYQKSAERAVNRPNVPPAERQRVKRYFESLSGGKPE